MIRPGPFGSFQPRAWQARAYPEVVRSLANGYKPIVSAVMGAGKSVLIGALCNAAFTHKPKRTVVVTAPRKALVEQLSATIQAIAGPYVGQWYSDRKQVAPIIVTCNMSLPTLAAELASRNARVSLLIADEAHSTEGETTRETIPLLRARGMVGFTATPFRSVDSETLSLWTNIAYRYTLEEALSEGVLVPWRTVAAGPDGDLSCLHEALRQPPPMEVEHGVDDVVYRAIVGYTDGPGVVSCMNIPDAHAYAEYLTKRGVSAKAIHSKLKKAERVALIDALSSGKLKALCHVSLLAEGVDFPWLRWLALRRPVSAPVRFMQEIGRPLRCDEGKTHAVLIDPHDLLGKHGIQHAEALGQALQVYADELQRKAEVKAEKEAYRQQLAELPPATAVAHSTLWCRNLLLGMQAAGVAQAAGVRDGYWRDLPPNQKQIDKLKKLNRTFTKHLPETQRKTIQALMRAPRALQSGAVADLTSILRTVQSAAPYPWNTRIGWVYEIPGIQNQAELSKLTLDKLRGIERRWN